MTTRLRGQRSDRVQIGGPAWRAAIWLEEDEMNDDLVTRLRKRQMMQDIRGTGDRFVRQVAVPDALCQLAADEIERLREKYESACRLAADMHEAATGARAGPRVGVVEDVAALRADMERLQTDKTGLAFARNQALSEIQSLRWVLHDIAEEWAGAECGEPVTAQEAYAISLAKRMYRLATEGLSGNTVCDT